MNFKRLRFGQTQYVWRAACASRLRVAHCRHRRRVAPTRYCVAHMRLAHTRHWRLWLARALALPLANCPPPRWLTAPAPSTRFARLRRRASRGVDSASAARWLAGPPVGAASGGSRRCARRGGAASAARHWRTVSRLAGCRSRAPRAAAASGGGSNSFFPPPEAAGKKNCCNKPSMFHVKQKNHAQITLQVASDAHK